MHADYIPNNITKEEYDKLLNIDKELHALAIKEEKYNYAQVANYIYNNLTYDLDYSRFKVVGSASIRTTRNLRDQSNVYTDESDRARAQILVTYPFYDAKEANERKQKMMTTKQKIISDTKKYFELKAELEDLRIEKLILQELEIRTKARKLKGVGSFDDWLKVIKDMKDNNFKIVQKKIELSESKQILFSYIAKNKTKTLESML